MRSYLQRELQNKTFNHQVSSLWVEPIKCFKKINLLINITIKQIITTTCIVKHGNANMKRMILAYNLFLTTSKQLPSSKYNVNFKIYTTKIGLTINNERKAKLKYLATK
jgi:hypothetical protein